MEFVLSERDLIQFIRRNFDAALIPFLVETDFDGEAGLRPRGCNQVHDALIVRQGTAAPIYADVREKPMLNLVPLARSRRKVAHRYPQLFLIGQLLQFSFPQV